MKKRKPQKPLHQTTLDEFTGGDMLVGASAPGATIKDAPTQPTLFGAQPPRQSIFVTDSDIPSATRAGATSPSTGSGSTKSSQRNGSNVTVASPDPSASARPSVETSRPMRV